MSFTGQVKKSSEKKSSTAKMDLANRALCFALRNPPEGTPKTPYNKIRELVRKTDGTKPTPGAMCDAAKNFKIKKGQVGRPAGSKKTSKKEDKKLLDVFHEIRPPGHGVTSRRLHKALPKKISKKISPRTCRRRLADKGFIPTKKLSKSDPGVQGTARRMKFGRAHKGWSSTKWKSHLQGVGDIKEFTHYPQALHATFTKLKSPWTYMTKVEKKLPAFQRPKRWFPKKEYEKTKKQKVFGLTTSNGKSIEFLVPTSWNSEVWAGLVRSKLVPFLKKAYPGKASFQLLLDGEKLLHAPPARKAYADGGITILPNWPKYSPDLNPQENVWAWAEPRLRELETDTTSFPDWTKLCLQAVKAYPSKEKLVATLAKRVEMLLDRNGSMLPV